MDADNQQKRTRRAARGFGAAVASYGTVRATKRRRGDGTKNAPATIEVGFTGRMHVNASAVMGLGNDPARAIGSAIRNALNPDLAPRPVKSFADMSPEEQAEMRRLYERSAKKSG